MSPSGESPQQPTEAARLSVEALAAEAVAAEDDPTRALSDLAGGEIVAIGIPMFESDEGPVLAGEPDLDPLRHLLGGDAQTRQTARIAQTSSLDRELFIRQGFAGKSGQSMTVLRPSGDPALVYLGCGEPDKVTTDELRRASAALVRSSGRSGVAAFLLPASLAEAAGDEPSTQVAQRRAVEAVTSAAILGAYRFSAHKHDEEHRVVDRLLVAGIGLDQGALEEGVTRGRRVAAAVCTARDMVNEPPSSMTPKRVAEVTGTFAGSRPRTTVEVWDLARIENERLGGLLGVARGSAEEPRLVRIDYEPDQPIRQDGRVPHVVLVGKGITFDSGGLSLKTPEGMVTMKTDMSGAATVIATIGACADLGVKVRVSAIAPLTENMPGGRATKPGDVLKIRDGQTIEVLNTDAEGRLILADALSLAAEMRPDAIIDLATLTGAAVVSLGTSIAGIFGNDDTLVHRLEACAERAGEALWRLPLAPQYKSHIDSDVADMKNIGKPGQAGAIVAALLLERFVGDIPWVHIDMAGPARSDKDDGVLTKGGTAFGVQTLLEYLSAFGTAPAPSDG